MQIIPLRFAVIDISTVTERLIASYAACLIAGSGDKLTPTIVGIFYLSIAAVVNKLDYIALCVAEIIEIVSPSMHSKPRVGFECIRSYDHLKSALSCFG